MSLLHPAIYENKSTAWKILYAIATLGFPALIIYYGLWGTFIYKGGTATFKFQFLSATLLLAFSMALFFTYFKDVKLWVIRTGRSPYITFYAWLIGGFMVFFGVILALEATDGLLPGMITIFLGLFLVLIGFFSKEVKMFVVARPQVKNFLTALGALVCILLLIALAYVTVWQYGIIFGVLIIIISIRLAAR